MRKYKINDILYTKDGRKSGNLVIIDLVEQWNQIYYLCISDYGNTITINSTSKLTGFFKEPGIATESHKHHNYKELNPEEFI